MKGIIKLLILSLIGTKCFGWDIASSSLEMTINVDTVYTYPYEGLWFRKSVSVENILG
jgi:hypothetical protein